MIKRPIHMSHDFLAEVLDDESIVVDATMGNGNDTAFLAGLSKKVYAFDVQEQAIGKTSQRLSDLGIENTELILDGHENLDHYVREPIRAAAPARAGPFCSAPARPRVSSPTLTRPLKLLRRFLTA